MASKLRREEIAPRMRELVSQLFRDVPTGVGAASALSVPVPLRGVSPSQKVLLAKSSARIFGTEFLKVHIPKEESAKTKAIEVKVS
jgi:hypothetical protein